MLSQHSTTNGSLQAAVSWLQSNCQSRFERNNMSHAKGILHYSVGAISNSQRL